MSAGPCLASLGKLKRQTVHFIQQPITQTRGHAFVLAVYSHQELKALQSMTAHTTEQVISVVLSHIMDVDFTAFSLHYLVFFSFIP